MYHKIVLKAVLKALLPFLAGIGLFLVFHFKLFESEALLHILFVAAEVLFTLSFGILIYFLADIPIGLLVNFSSKSESKIDDMLVPIASKILRILIIVLIIVQVIHEITGQPVATLLAGLGVVGLAIGLALQDSAKNFFGAFIIFMDKPFELGDIIKVDSFEGEVFEVGLRSTKLRGDDGDIISIPNGLFTNKIIRKNYYE